MTPTLPFHYNLPTTDSKSDCAYFGNLSGAGLCAFIADAYQKLTLSHDGPRNRPMLVISDTPEAARRLEESLPFFLSHSEGADSKLLFFPDWETLPFDQFSPHQDIVSERIKTLSLLPQGSGFLAITSLLALLHRLPPLDYVEQNSFVLQSGQTWCIDQERIRLERLGYRCVETVYEHGEFAVRGSIVDIFPMGNTHPIRIDLFDDSIDSLRAFDPDSQRSTETFDAITLLPARETPLSENSISTFKQQFRRRFDTDYLKCPLYQDVSEGIASAGIEYYLPLFFEQTSSLFHYLPDDCLIVLIGDINAALQQYWGEINERYEQRRHDRALPIVAPQELYLSEPDFFQAIKGFSRIFVSSDQAPPHKPNAHNFSIAPAPNIAVNARAPEPLSLFKNVVQQAQNDQLRILLLAESTGRREHLLELLRSSSLNPKVVSDWQAFINDDTPFCLSICALEQGVVLQEAQLLILTESQLLGQKISQTRRRKDHSEQSDAMIGNLTELKIGAPVVHLDHGVGRYRGLVTLEIDNQAQEFLLLQYRDEAKLYVPVCSLHLISRYTGADSEQAPCNQLGSETWQKEKRKALEKLHDTAAHLLNVYARRAAKPGLSYGCDQHDYTLFESEFPFEETPDQSKAIAEVIADLKAPRPMDRLICGDVGFGKTEVAMRATFIVVESSKQVAVLVPTTLLAQQHYQTFQDRFAAWPVRVEVISRFKTSKEQKQIIEKVKAGQIDIIIGTHKLLQSDIAYHDLGLIIIDEEHRFGVKDKEKLKSLRADVDILTMTATPIPRTLNLAMANIRDISIIATAPDKRLSIKTFVRQSNDTLIKEAILRELRRGGQIYYLHNEVKNITQTAQHIESLVPEARIGIAHGQLRERQLEQVMSDFYHKRFNILVCTTIIETGIDIPTANTIIIDRADKFGLAQLHQLRGRVGRSHHQAYAFLLTPHPKALTADATKRLEAIAEADTLGAGFTLASHDLEIRGAGELLGEEQSGHITKIGFSLYMEMLDRAVNAIKKGKTPNLDKPLENGCEINLRAPALIPESYLPDVHLRLLFYKRIAGAPDEKALTALKIEMIDRFGLLPEPIHYLFAATKLKLQVQSIGLTKIEFGPTGGYIDFEPNTNANPSTLVKWVQTKPNEFGLSGASRLRLARQLDSVDARLEYLSKLCQDLVQ